MKKLTGILSISIIMMSCHGSVSVGEVTVNGEKVISNYNSDPKAKIKNNIQLKENGLKVSEAYLVKEDGSPVSDDNLIGAHDNLTLRLVVDGWKIDAGRVKVGASEKIVAADGSTPLDQADLFADMKDADANDARKISIDADFKTSQKDFGQVTVSFRVWDKVSNSDVTGSYKLTFK